MVGKTLGRYRIFEKIGSGGWGDVYRARDERLDRDVALKVLSQRALEEDSSRKRFRKEALVLSRLNHPNIATILDFDTQEGLDFLVMEYISGTTLHDLVSKGRLEEKDIIHYATQIAAALEDAHQVGIVHRDLKPSNVLVTPKGQVKVLDFGLAKLLHPNNSPVTHLTTETNLVVGTFPYMSPEQLRTEPPDARSDIYSFGVTLYEMATGQRPHQESQPISLADAILHKQPIPPLTGSSGPIATSSRNHFEMFGEGAGESLSIRQRVADRFSANDDPFRILRNPAFDETTFQKKLAPRWDCTQEAWLFFLQSALALFFSNLRHCFQT